MQQDTRERSRLALGLVYAFYLRSWRELRTMQEVKLAKILAAMILARMPKKEGR
jgi:hypothetical protein